MDILKFVPLTLVILMPITLNIFLFHVVLTPGQAGMSIVMLAVHLYLAWSYRDYYKALVDRKAPLSL